MSKASVKPTPVLDDHPDPHARPQDDPLLAGLARLPKTVSADDRRPALPAPRNAPVAPSRALAPVTAAGAAAPMPSSSSSSNGSSRKAQLRRSSPTAVTVGTVPSPVALPHANTTHNHDHPHYHHNNNNNNNNQSHNNNNSNQANRFNFNVSASTNTPVQPRVEPLDPVPRVDVQETVERATGLGRGDAAGWDGGAVDDALGFDRSDERILSRGDRIAIHRLLFWMRAGAIDATSVFRMIVAGTDENDAHFNIRVLAVVQILCVLGGPVIVAGALHVTHPRRPNAILRIIIDVLRTNASSSSLSASGGGGGVGGLLHDDIEGLLHDDGQVLNLREEVLFNQSLSSSSAATSPTSSYGHHYSHRSLKRKALQAYAIMLGRKFIFHQRFVDVEINYSLDRFYRAINVENLCDGRRREVNDERHSIIISKAAFVDMSMITSIATVTALLLERVHADRDAFLFVLADAVNAAALTSYLAVRTDSTGPDEHNIDREVRWLGAKVRALVERPTSTAEVRLLNKLIDFDSNMYKWLMDKTAALSLSNPNNKRHQQHPQTAATAAAAASRPMRPCRPESRHRRDIVCHFSSFQSMHKALTPPTLSGRTPSYR